MEISLDKKYKTKSGMEVRLYAVDAGGVYPIHGAYLVGNEWRIRRWTNQGHSPYGQEQNLVESKSEKWVNLYWTAGGSFVRTGCAIYSSQGEAERYIGDKINYIKAVQIS